jgi:hypothetical protein
MDHRADRHHAKARLILVLLVIGAGERPRGPFRPQTEIIVPGARALNAAGGGAEPEDRDRGKGGA